MLASAVWLCDTSVWRFADAIGCPFFELAHTWNAVELQAALAIAPNSGWLGLIERLFASGAFARW